MVGVCEAAGLNLLHSDIATGRTDLLRVVSQQSDFGQIVDGIVSDVAVLDFDAARLVRGPEGLAEIESLENFAVLLELDTEADGLS
jgi:hypothetical protein